MSQFLRRAIRALGPAVPAGRPAEALRAGFGAALGLGAAGVVLLSPVVDPQLGLYLIAPFGATSVLVFAVPSSPLAQPFTAIVGNAVSALVGVAACLLIADPLARIALAVGVAIAAMILCRALHPPGGAVAMTAAMSPGPVLDLGWWFALCPVALGTAALVGAAILYGRPTGRHYPFRQFEDRNSHGTGDPEPAERLGLSEADLNAILGRYRQALNLGVEDLARLIAAAEMQAAGQRAGPIRAADIMSRDLVTVGPGTALREVAALFRQHGFTSIPVVMPGGEFLGVIFQLHLIRCAGEDASRAGRGFRESMARLFGRTAPAGLAARDIMAAEVPVVAPDAPVGALLPPMAEGGCDAVPVLDDGRLVGIVTRTDLIAALARQSLRP
ncbi:HPP family protein [Paracoccus spongiarum]|uniref:HPP family protein n=1 Tax=Paracoccus spongiarum TaxID=3064387 RepID=A0ABT9J6V3_9RHOB|nr:HPP family protein [Paracoccus sp. 2205BS29-5]MDP5305512.1 HPP family protein [Paracoccus sp. 2205BS29-5]